MSAEQKLAELQEQLLHLALPRLRAYQEPDNQVDIRAGAGSTIVVNTDNDESTPSESHHRHPRGWHTVLVDSDYQATEEDYYIGVVTCHDDEITITLPCHPNNGREIVVKLEVSEDYSNHSKEVKVVGSHHALIDGRKEVELDHHHTSVTVIYRGSQWHQV